MATAVTQMPGDAPPVMPSAFSLGERRDAVAGCVGALRDLHTLLYQCPSGELADLAGDLAEIRALAGAGLAGVIAEATVRGVVDASQYASTTAWVADCAWHSRREAATLAKAAAILNRPDLAALAGAVREVDIDPATAVAIAGEYDKLKPDLRDDAKPVVLGQFLAVGADHGPAGVRRLKQELLARYGEHGEFEDHQERCRRQIDLSAGRETSAGVWNYSLTTDNEGRAVLEAAIGPLSAPQPNPDTGEADPRPAGRCRGEALIEALRRSVSAAQHVPTSPKAILMLTMDFQDLAAQTGAARAAGTLAADAPIAPDTARKVACDAGVIPAVLGGAGEILDLGRAERLFTTGQVRALWLRDGHCTFLQCDIPAAWCHAHHLVHWVDGGPTDLDNAALLCGRHQTILHRDRLAGVVTTTVTETGGTVTETGGTVTETGGAITKAAIIWDLRPNSYRPPEREPGAGADTRSDESAHVTGGLRANSYPPRPPPAGRARTPTPTAEPGDRRSGQPP